MEEVNLEVSKIQTQLHSSRRQLHNLETKAQKSISTEVDRIRTSLRRADNRIEDVSSQAQSFMKRLDNIEFANITVNMNPQMIWLHDNLSKIVKDLEETHSKTDSAISCTNTYVYQALDVKQDVDSNNNKLTEHFDTATNLLNEAQAEVAASEMRLDLTQRSISAKQREINEKTYIASSKRQHKAQLERQCQDKRNEIVRARRERQDRKEQGLASGGLAVLGVIAAPFSGGLSLALTAAGVAGATYKASRMDDFDAQANNLQQSVNILNNEISTNSQAVNRLEEEKSELQSQIWMHRAEVARKKVELEDLERRTSATNETKQEITALQNHAASTTANVKKTLVELKAIQNSLEQCNALIKERSTEVSTTETLSERMIGALPLLGTSLRRGKLFQKQHVVMEQICETLNQIHSQVPTLLPAQTAKFLDVKSWNSRDACVSVVEMGTTIPDTCMYAT